MTEALQTVLDSAYSRPDYPALSAQAQSWRRSRPFAGLRVIDATPVFNNTLAKYLPLLAGGADLTVFLSPLLPHDQATAATLRSAGIKTLSTIGDDYDIVMDCAGVLSSLSRPSVELTRSGTAAYAHHPKPVFVVDDSRIKVIETSLGTGDGFVRGLAHFGHADLRGRHVVVFGCGKVGRGAAMRARAAGAKVTLVDPNPDAQVPRGCELIDPEGPVPIEDAWCVVSATGIAGALEPWADRLESSHAILANLGAEDEFGPSMPPARVLNDKAPVNFALAEPTRLRYLDAIMALSNACALELDGQAPGIQPVPEGLEAEILTATRTHGVITDELTELEERM